jgi:Thaumarchaeal output domain 1
MSGIVSDSEKEFLVSLVEKGVDKLEPQITPDGVQYNDIDYTDTDWKIVIQMLKNLETKEMLKGEDFDRVIICPNCDSPHVYSKYACPTDRSIHIRKVTLLRHEHDGYLGELRGFEKKGRLICPQCNQDLGDANDKSTWASNLKEVGFSFECEHNKHRFERPLVLHFCPECGSMFDYKTARYMPLNVYSLTQKAYALVKSSSDTEKIIKPIVDYLKANGLEIQYGLEVKGVSGSTHKFDLAASVGSSLLVIDYSFGDSRMLVALLGKKLDIPGVEAALVDFSDNEELVNLGKVYNIPIINTGKGDWAKTLETVTERMKKPPEGKKETPRRSIWERIR